MRYVHEIDDGGRWIIGDAIDAGLDWTIPPGEIWRPGTEAIGTEVAAPIPAPVPEEIEKFQMYTWLWTNKQVTEANLMGIIETVPPEDQEPARIALKHHPRIRRSSPWVSVLGAALEMDADALDQAFREAALL